MRIALSTILCAVIFAGFFCSCKKAGEQQVVARVGDVQLTVEELREAMPALKDHKLGRLQMERYVQQWLESELIFQQAVKEKYDRDSQVRRQLEKLQKDYIVSVYLQEKVDDELQVNDADLQEYYQKNGDEFKCDEDLYRLDLILLETQVQAKEVRSRIVAGEDFAAVAKSQSLDFSRFQGGHLGFVTLRQISPLLAAAVSRMSADEISQPVKSELGYNLIRLQGMTKKGMVQPFEEVKDVVAQRMRAKKREEMYEKLIARLSDKVDLSSDLSVLSLE